MTPPQPVPLKNLYNRFPVGCRRESVHARTWVGILRMCEFSSQFLDNQPVYNYVICTLDGHRVHKHYYMQATACAVHSQCVTSKQGIREHSPIGHSSKSSLLQGSVGIIQAHPNMYDPHTIACSHYENDAQIKEKLNARTYCRKGP